MIARLLLLAVLLASLRAAASEDPALDKRVSALASELRCLVCQNQTLADSNAPLAVDLRNQIREQLKAGASERDVTDYMVARYGDFVLYRPPLKTTTALLWFGPLILVVIGAGVGVVALRRRRRRVAAAPLSAEETRRLEHLLRRRAS